MQTTAIRTVVNSLPKNEVILLTILISRRYIPYTDLLKILPSKYFYVCDTFIPIIMRSFTGKYIKP